MENKDLFVGRSVWYIPTYNRVTPVLIETKVASVAKKYFKLDEGHLGRFFIDSLKHDGGDYSPRYKIYLNKEDYDIEVERDKLFSEIRHLFSYKNESLNITQLRQIHSIIKP